MSIICTNSQVDILRTVRRPLVVVRGSHLIHNFQNSTFPLRLGLSTVESTVRLYHKSIVFMLILRIFYVFRCTVRFSKIPCPSFSTFFAAPLHKSGCSSFHLEYCHGKHTSPRVLSPKAHFHPEYAAISPSNTSTLYHSVLSSLWLFDDRIHFLSICTVFFLYSKLLG